MLSKYLFYIVLIKELYFKTKNDIAISYLNVMICSLFQLVILMLANFICNHYTRYRIIKILTTLHNASPQSDVSYLRS